MDTTMNMKTNPNLILNEEDYDKYYDDDDINDFYANLKREILLLTADDDDDDDDNFKEEGDKNRVKNTSTNKRVMPEGRTKNGSHIEQVQLSGSFSCWIHEHQYYTSPILFRQVNVRRRYSNGTGVFIPRIDLQTMRNDRTRYS